MRYASPSSHTLIDKPISISSTISSTVKFWSGSYSDRCRSISWKKLYWEQYDIEYRIIWLVRDPSDVISEQWGQGSARRQRWGWEKLLSCGRTILGRPMKHWTNNSEYTVRETLHKTTNLLSLYRTSKNVFSSMMKHFGLLWRIYFIIVWEFR